MNTEIIVVVDTSSSMLGTHNAAYDGLNEFVSEQRKLPGEAKLSLYEFSNQAKNIFRGKRLSDVPEYKMEPLGMTALLDGIGFAMDSEGKRIRNEAWADQVIFVVITDGGENWSNYYDYPRIREMVKHAEDHGWKFIFMGANQDSVLSSRNLGMTSAATPKYEQTVVGTRSAYSGMSATVTSMRS